MAIRDYWIYQKRDVPCPWAIYIVKEYDRRKLENTMIDFTFYHENVPNSLHAKSFVGLRHETIAGYVNDIECEILEFVSVHAQDHDQLMTEMARILA